MPLTAAQQLHRGRQGTAVVHVIYRIHFLPRSCVLSRICVSSFNNFSKDVLYNPS